MKNQILLFFSSFALMASAQEVADFENIVLDPESFNNGSDFSGGFTSGEGIFPTEFVSEFNWSGWAISNTTDVTTPGFMNQYSAITGSGFASTNYALAFQNYLTGETAVTFDGETALNGFYITNSTYAYLSMLNGDSFSKKFGGLTGNDPDFFLLTINAYVDGVSSGEPIEFYLADFTFSDNSQDYIVDEWTFVDLSGFGSADSLIFVLTSSDVGEFGMNTPAYFCIDNFTTNGPLSFDDAQKPLFNLFPNPSSDWIQINSSEVPDLIRVFDMNGRMVLEASNTYRLNVQRLEVGSYILQVTHEQRISSRPFMRN
ncbi:MAG: DUF4465 domain-containing protein [Flavobacteriales bacterium]|nr:DUF4465 domain-containing protein [Flavobacteriales bacterium]